MRPARARPIAVLATAAVLALPALASATIQTLPPGAQLNDDPAAGIKPLDPVGLGTTTSDVTAGSLLAGGARAPWAVFQQTSSADVKTGNRIYVRALVNGVWRTQGAGTVGGASSGQPSITPGALNFSQDSPASAPTIDFAGPGRTVPWAAWTERQSQLQIGPAAQLYTARFHPSSAATHPNTWEFAGANRTAAGPPVPSLNLHTNQDAANPSVAGGSTSDPAKPGPWIAWQETSPTAPYTGRNQVVVARPSDPNPTNCADFKLGDAPVATPPQGGFCFGAVGLERIGGDVSLNVDRGRDGVEPDIAFSGDRDATPWVVWTETGTHGTTGLHDNSMVFAARAAAPTVRAVGTVLDGGLGWTVVGSGAQSTLATGTVGSTCAVDFAHEADCSLNADSARGQARQVRIASGSTAAGQPPVPWVVWTEQTPDGIENVYAAHLTGSGDAARFTLANGGKPLGTGLHPDIAFAGHTPYVTWWHLGTFVSGHLTAAGSFVADGAPVPTLAQLDDRAPIATTCGADPATADGERCAAGQLGTPFFLTVDGTPDVPNLRARTYAPTVATGAADGVHTTTATVHATVDPQGAAATVRFQYGRTTAYGSTTAATRVAGTATSGQPAAAVLSGLPAGTTVHYRAVAASDLALDVGADRTLTTPRAHTTRAKLAFARTTLRRRVAAKRLSVRVTVDGAAAVRVGATTRVRVHGRTRTVSLGRTTVKFTRAGHRTATIRLAASARGVLRRLRTAKVTFSATATSPGGRTTKHLTATIRR
jgi:hypothetical protein